MKFTYASKAFYISFVELFTNKLSTEICYKLHVNDNPTKLTIILVIN